MPNDVFEQIVALMEGDPSIARQMLDALVATGAASPDALEQIAAQITDAQLVDLIRARSSVNDSVIYAHHVYAEVEALARRHGGSTRDVLEIGPGANLGALFCFACGGARTVTGIDVADAPPKSLPFYQTLAAYLCCVEGFRWWRFVSSGNRFPGVAFPNSAENVDVEAQLERIDLRHPDSAGVVPVPNNSYDVVYSVAALEHVRDPASTVNEMHRLLRSGGLAIHEIDLKHHGCSDPLRFLEMTEDDWTEVSAPYGNERSLRAILDATWDGEVYCNRLRMSDWQRCFREAGFGIEWTEPLVVLAPQLVRKERFVPEFRSHGDEDLAVVAFRIVARA